MLLLLLTLSLAVGQLFRLELIPGVVIYLHDILVLLTLIFHLPKLRHFSSPYIRPILSFVAIAALSLIFSFRPLNQIIVGSLYLWRWLAYALIYFVARQSP